MRPSVLWNRPTPLAVTVLSLHHGSNGGPIEFVGGTLGLVQNTNLVFWTKVSIMHLETGNPMAMQVSLLKLSPEARARFDHDKAIASLDTFKGVWGFNMLFNFQNIFSTFHSVMRLSIEISKRYFSSGNTNLYPQFWLYIILYEQIPYYGT